MKKTTPVKVKRAKSKLGPNRVAQVMIEKEISTQELADAIDSTPSHVTRIIGQQRPCLSLPLALKIARKLEMPVEKLFFLEEKK